MNRSLDFGRSTSMCNPADWSHVALVPSINPSLLVSKSNGRLSQPFTDPLARTHTAFAIRKGDPDFLNYLNTWLLLQRDSGWLDERLHHWNLSTESGL